MTKLKLIKMMMQTIRGAWLLFGVSLLSCALLEGAFSFAFHVLDRFTVSDTRMFDSRAQADNYRQIPWAERYFKEINESFAARWEPYVYWRRRPYAGQYITVNADGMRVTPDSGIIAENAQSSFRVFMFGGSTIWGTGARDLFTIPALLEMQLRKRGLRVEVVNFGETGYVSTQEVLTLLLQLRNGNIPDLVIFYDGVNDAYSAYQQGIAGWPQNEFNRAREFNLTRRLPELKGMVMRDVVTNLATVRFAKGLLRRIGAIETEQRPKEWRIAEKDAGRLAEGVVNAYLNNVKVVEALGASYNFKYRFYWQPTVFEKKRLTDYEKGEFAGQKHLETFLKEIHRILIETTTRLRADKTFHDFSAIFADVEEAIYIDWMHVNERGNAIIAQAMMEQASGLVQSGGRSHLQPSQWRP